MKLNLNKKAIAIALSLALATPIISATAFYSGAIKNEFINTVNPMI